MIDVVGPSRTRRTRRTRRVRPGIKRLLVLGLLLFGLSALWPETSEEQSDTAPHALIEPGALEAFPEVVPNYLLAEMAPWRAQIPLSKGEAKASPKRVESRAQTQRYPHRDPELSLKLQRLLEDYRVPEGAIVVLDTETGEIVGLAGVRNSRKDHSVAFEAKWPAASLFKTVTASALLKSGKTPSKSCYNVGYRRINQSDLRRSSGRTCADLTLAYGRSYNIHFGQWANRWLSPSKLEQEARNLGFGAESWVPGYQAGKLELPEDAVDFANTAAGFGDAPMSPYQAAMISSAIGSGGEVSVRNHMTGKLQETRRLFSSAVAGKLQEAMKATVVRGSARKAFRAHGKPALGAGGAAGKTGSLMADGHDLTWFSGFAPAESPRYAVAVMIANDPTWHVKAPYVGREALRSALFDHTPYRPTHLLAAR